MKQSDKWQTHWVPHLKWHFWTFHISLYTRKLVNQKAEPLLTHWTLCTCAHLFTVHALETNGPNLPYVFNSIEYALTLDLSLLYRQTKSLFWSAQICLWLFYFLFWRALCCSNKNITILLGLKELSEQFCDNGVVQNLCLWLLKF